MHDGIINGTGDSRYVKSVADFKRIYPDFDSFAQALIDGTLLIDLNGINPGGWAQIGTAVNTNNILPDETAETIGLDPEDDPSPNDAFLKLSERVSEAQSTADTATSLIGPPIGSTAHIVTGTYPGNGRKGVNEKTRIDFSAYGRTPYVLFVGSLQSSEPRWIVMVYGATSAWSVAQTSAVVNITWEATAVSWYNASYAKYQLNQTNETYRYVAIF